MAKRKIKVSVDAEAIPFGTAIDEFIEEKEALNKSKSTINNYLQSVRLFMEFHNYDSNTPISAVTPQNFYRWSNTLKQNGNSINGINHYLRDCRVFFNWCMSPEQGYLEKFQIKLLDGQEEQIKLFSDDELEALLEKPHKPTKSNDYFTEWRMWAIVNWVLGTGNRGSTIVAVQMGDVDFTHKEIVLRHTKNKKASTIPLSSSLESVLKEYIKWFRKGASADSYLFPNVGDEQLTTNALRHSFAKYCKDREVESTNLHGLRHNFAKGWIRNSGDVFRLQKILGHSDLQMTRRYVALFNEDLKEDFDKFNPLDNIKKNSSRRKAIRANIEK